MPTLLRRMLPLLGAFTPVFSRRGWQHALVLVIGTLRAPGKRTVTAAFHVMGLARDERLERYHRVLNRAHWSGLTVSRILLGLLVATFARGGRWSSASTRRWSAAVASTSRPRGLSRRRALQPRALRHG